MARVPAPRRRIRSALIALLLAVFSVCLAGPAGAHSDLESSSPKAGATLTELPTEVTLTFNEKVQEGFSQVAVVDGEGLSVTDGDPVSDGATVTQPLMAKLHPGGYVINFKVVSADGHPISDAIPFTIAEGAGSASATESDSPTSAEASASAPAATATTPAATGETAATTAAAGTSSTGPAGGGDGSGGGPATALLVILGVLVLAGGMGAAAMLRARGPQA